MHSYILFESPHRLHRLLNELRIYCGGEREIHICRELTKIHETFYRSKVSDVDEFEFTPKGEVTVIISEKKNDYKIDLNESDKKKIQELIKKKSVKDIVRIFSQEKNISKSKIYNYCLQIKNEN